MSPSPPALRPATIHIWCGTFASQALVFAHLMDLGVEDLDRFEVLSASDTGRLGHFGISMLPPGAQGTLILQAGDLNSAPPFQDSQYVTYLGAHAGQRYE